MLRRRTRPRATDARSIIRALVAAVALAGAGRAHADAPIVTIVGHGDAIELSRALPAGVAWKAKLAVRKDVVTQGTVAVWPAAAGSCGAAQAIPDDADRFALAGDPSSGELIAELPALQFAVSYCLALTVRQGLTTPEAERAARPAVESVAPHLRVVPLEADPLGAQLAAALHTVLAQNLVKGVTRETLDPLMVAVARDYIFSSANRDYVTAHVTAAAAPSEATDQRDREAKTAAHAALVVLIRDALRELRVEAAFTSKELRVPESTPSPQNYASIDLGVAIGVPFTEDAGAVEALWMPYLGVNLYFCGVDRTFPLSQQRGGFFRTRFALTLGISLDEPTLAGRELQGFLFGKIPLVAVGARITQYTRASVGAMFYQWPDDSPAEDDPDFGAALFVGYSLDLDVVSWIKGNAAGYGGI